MPKFNLYQSLHTTVVGPQGKPVEVQIRTHEMHRRAEYGIAAHWGYKERSRAEDLAWLQRMVDWQQDTDDPSEFIDTLKIDLEQDEVFVFTPKGKVITLADRVRRPSTSRTRSTPRSGTAASARASTAGSCRSTARLESGDTVEIFTSKVDGAGPEPRLAPVRAHAASPLEDPAVVLARAPRRRDRHRARRAGEGAAQGRPPGAAGRAVRRRSSPSPSRCTTRTSTRCTQRSARVTSRRVPSRSACSASCAAARSSSRSPRSARHASARAEGGAPAGVHVEGLDDVMVRLSRCCTPVPGDEIMGFVTRGRGVSVHRTDCANAVVARQPGAARHRGRVGPRRDRRRSSCRSRSRRSTASRLLRDVAQVLSEHHVNILTSTSQTSSDRVARFRFEFELADPSHLDSLLKAVQRVDSVYDAYRVLPGAAARA